jgi:hypothetical protein
MRRNNQSMNYDNYHFAHDEQNKRTNENIYYVDARVCVCMCMCVFVCMWDSFSFSRRHDR